MQYNPCGCVYRMKLDSQYSGYAMDALICGTPLSSNTTAGFVPKNQCWMDGISEPDNLAYLSGHDQVRASLFTYLLISYL